MDFNPWFVMLLGMGTVFFGLFCLIMLTKLMSAALRLGDKKKNEPQAPAQAAPVPAPAVAGPQDMLFASDGERRQFDAVVCGALAEYMGEGVEKIRIHSIRKLEEPYFDRGSFTAAVSAALATAMGRNVKGIRIVNMTKLN